MKIAIQCVDINSGEIGTFAHFGDFRAVTRIYPDCVGLVAFLRSIGYEMNEEGEYV